MNMSTGYIRRFHHPIKGLISMRGDTRLESFREIADIINGNGIDKEKDMQ